MRRIIPIVLAAALTACAGPGENASSHADRTPGDARERAGDARSRSGAGPAPHDVATASADSGARAGAAGDASEPREPGVIVFVGTSLTAGYGIGAERAYPAVLQQKLDSAQLPFRVRNAGISGETSAGGLRRIDWVLQTPIDVLVLELGANDGLRGLDPAQMEENLDAIIRRTRDAYPDADVLLLGMEAPPNLGRTYTDRFRNVYRELAEEHDAVLVPFLLEGVAGVPALNQADGLHPTAEGQRRMAETVWAALQTIVAARMANR
jgi:acyl-CoA thioesterase-1